MKRELISQPIANEFLQIVKLIEKEPLNKRVGRTVEYYTTSKGFYINYFHFHGTFAIGEKTHPEQFIFENELQAQERGCTEFLEWYNLNKEK